MVKLAILVIIYVAILVHDIPRLKECHRRSIFIYAIIMFTAVYQSIMFVFDLKWPFLHTLIDVVFNEPASYIVELLKVPAS